MKDKHLKVRQSNNLIESPYAQEFTAHEIKLFEIAAAGVTINDQIKSKSFINKRYSLSTTQLATLLNTSTSVISHEIEKTATRIMKKTIHLRKILEDGEVEFERITIIPYAKYKDGIFEFDLNYNIVPYLVEINKNFTEYQLNHILAMNSSYAIKLYKLLYQYKKICKREFTVEDLKEQFGIKEKYPEYKDFRKRILIPAVDKINKTTDLKVEYDEYKPVRKVLKIIFTFKVNENISAPNQVIDVQPIDIEGTDDINNKINSIIEEIPRKVSKPTQETIKDYYLKKGEDYVIASIKHALDKSKKNFNLFLQQTLKGEWALDRLYEIEQQKNAKSKEENLKLIEAEKENKRREVLIKRELEVKETFYNLSVEDRTSIYAELVTQVAKVCPDKMDMLIKNQEDYIIAYWAGKNKLKYKGHLHLNLEVWKILI